MSTLHDELAAIVTAHVPDSMAWGDRRDLLDALTAWIDAKAAAALAVQAVLHIDGCERKLAEQREAIAKAMAAKSFYSSNPAKAEGMLEAFTGLLQVVRDFGKEATS